MGWTGIPKSRVRDRKEYMRSLWNDHVIIVKDVMVGTTWYAAAKITGKYTSESGLSNWVRVSEEEMPVVAIMALTEIDGNEFMYKEMDETEGPYIYDCPVSILKLLTPTDNENANVWRKECWKRARQPKLSSVKIGQKIKAVLKNGQEMILVKHAPAYQFKNSFWMVDGKNTYCMSHLIHSFTVLDSDNHLSFHNKVGDKKIT